MSAIALPTMRDAGRLWMPGDRFRRLLERAELLRFAPIIFQPGSQYYDLSEVVQMTRQPAVSGPTTLIEAAFNADNGTLLSAYTIEPTNIPATAFAVVTGWTQTSSVQSNHARCDSSVTSSWNTVDAGVSDCIVSATLNFQSTAGVLGFIVRTSDSTHYWLIYWSYGTTIGLYEKAGGSQIQRGTATVTAPASNDQALSVTCNGTTITIALNGSDIITYGGASSNLTVTKHGMYLLSAVGPYADDFKITTLT